MAFPCFNIIVIVGGIVTLEKVSGIYYDDIVLARCLPHTVSIILDGKE